MNKKLIRKMLTASGGPIKKPIKRLKDGYRYIPDEKNGGWDRISDNSMADVFATMEFTPKKTKVGSSITRTLQPKTSNYRSAYNPDDIIKGFNALTLGGLNNLSPTQWARRYYDLNKLLISLIPGSKRTMTWSGFVNNWLNGNNGLVSEKFAQEHPYWSMGINGVGDAVALGGLANANKVKLVGDIAAKHGGDATKIAINVAKNSSKPFNWRNYKFLGDSKFYSDLDDAGYKTIMTERLSGNYPLTFTERKNYVSGLKNDIQKGVDYAINEAKTNVKAPLKLGKEVEYTFNGGKGWRLESYSPEDILPLLIHYGTLRATKKYGQTPWEGKYGAFQNENEGLFFPFRDRPNTLRTHSMFLDTGERISTGAHETRHTVQKYFDIPLTETRYDLPGTYGRYTNRELPLDFKKKVNEYINDALTAGEWEGSLGEMDAELTGWSAQHGFPRYSQMNPLQKALLHDLFLKRFGGNTDYKNYGEISSLLRLNPDYNTSLLYSKILDDSKIGQIMLGLEILGYRKQGGKMNILEFLKNGSGIHIKEKNKGLFTDYCGGKVTDECILKGKNSSNPAIRKRAVFALNARHFKHESGGLIVRRYLYGGPGYFLPENNLLLKFKDKLYNLSRRIMATANNVKDINYDTLPSGEPLEGVAQTTYLLPRHLQKEKFLEYGYKESPGDYGLVKKAVGNKKLPVYQKNPDVISRNKLQVVGNPNYTVWFGNSTEALTHAGNYPSAIYHDDLGNLYQKSWDLNDYGGGTGAYIRYSPKEKIMADIGDIIGNPVVVTTGFRPIYTYKDPEDKLANLLDTGEWKALDDIINSYLNKKGLHIDSYKENGNNIKFLSLPEIIIKAANARKWKHKKGGAVKALEGTKFNWGSAIGNLASTALLLGISTYMLNKKLSSDAEADKEKYKSEAASKLQKDMQDERTKRFNILNAIKGTSDNPNAFGGGIFENYFINLGDNEAIRNYNQSISDYNKMIDLQIRAQKAENTGNFLSSLGLLGVGLLANSAFNKNSTNTSSASTSATSSTNTSYNLSNFWSTPSLSNYLSNLSVLYNPDKFWNMNPK